MREFGKRLKYLRLKKNLSIKEIAITLNVSPSTYRDWEYGREIKGEPYIKLAEIFEVSLKYLLTGKYDSLEKDLLLIEETIRKMKNKL